MKAVSPLPVLAMYLIMYYLLAGVIPSRQDLFIINLLRGLKENRYIDGTIDRLSTSRRSVKVQTVPQTNIYITRQLKCYELSLR